MAKVLGSASHEFVMRRPSGPAQASVSDEAPARPVEEARGEPGVRPSE
jgi:hypothetical protein